MLKGMAFWLKIVGSLSIISSGILIAISAINVNQTNNNSKVSINDVTIITKPTVSYQVNQTYDELNRNPIVTNAVIAAIKQQKTVTVTTSDFTLTNNQIGIQKPAVDVTFTATATTNSLLITGNFKFDIILGKIDISSGVTVSDLMTPADSNNPYQTLNQNQSIIAAVISAIQTNLQITVTNDDFTLTNNQTGNQTSGTVVTFTVTANPSSTLIQGKFTFTNTLSAPDISQIIINDPKTVYNPYGNYDSLNSNQTIIDLVTNAIKTATNVEATVYLDFLISNNQPALNLQAAGTIVTITVTAIGTQLQGSFSFTDTLMLPNISNIVISDLHSTADPLSTYSALNNDITITDAVAAAINNAKAVYTQANVDFTITNNQIATANQVIGTVVTFTVTAIGNQIIGSFTFTDTLGPVDISYNVSVPDPQSATSPTDTYTSLNTNPYILTAVNNAINTAKGVNITNSEYTLTNDQIGNQTPGTVVTFTVTANPNSQYLTGSFIFKNTMSKVGIASGVRVADLMTQATPTQNYGDLNNNQTIINAVINAILLAKNVNVKLNVDFILRNNRSASVNQAAGVVVTFTVASLITSTIITGSFNFTDTLT